MSEMEYGREADEVIGLAFETGYNSELRRQRVANFLRELVAASHSGCTGYGVPLASPESDAPGSGLLPRRGLPSVADWARLKRTLPEREPIKERLDDDWTEAGPPGSWQAGEPKTPRHWGVRSRWSQPPLDPWPDGGIVIDPADPGSTSRPDVTSGEPEAEEGKES